MGCCYPWGGGPASSLRGSKPISSDDLSLALRHPRSQWPSVARSVKLEKRACVFQAPRGMCFHPGKTGLIGNMEKHNEHNSMFLDAEQNRHSMMSSCRAAPILSLQSNHLPKRNIVWTYGSRLRVFSMCLLSFVFVFFYHYTPQLGRNEKITMLVNRMETV